MDANPILHVCVCVCVFFLELAVGENGDVESCVRSVQSLREEIRCVGACACFPWGRPSYTTTAIYCYSPLLCGSNHGPALRFGVFLLAACERTAAHERTF